MSQKPAVTVKNVIEQQTHLETVLTLHGLDQTLDSVGSDAESSTLLHQDWRDVTVHVQIVYRLWIQAQRVHELPTECENITQIYSY